MHKPTVLSKLVAASVIAVLPMLPAAAIEGPTTASVRGTVYHAADGGPASGVRVHVGDPATGEVYPSSPTAGDGEFSVTGLPPSRYEVAVEADGGLYLVETPLELGAGDTRSVNLAIRKASQGGLEVEKSKPSLWSNPGTATAVVVGIAVAVGLVIDELDDDDDPTTTASPSGS